MARIQVRRRRQLDAHQSPGLLPLTWVTGVFGDQKARAVSFARRGKTLCGSCVHRQIGWYDRKTRRIRDLSSGDTRVWLELEVRRINCRRGGAVKTERLDFLADNPFYTKRFGWHIGWRCREASISDVADEFMLDWHTVKALDKQYMAEQVRRAGMPGDESRHRGYAPRVRTPVKRIPARRKIQSFISSITNQGKLRCIVCDGALSPALLRTFMQGLIRDARRKTLQILENHGVHKAKIVRDWVRERADQIELFYLELDFPDQNPDEHLNGDLERAVDKRCPTEGCSPPQAARPTTPRGIQRSKARARA